MLVGLAAKNGILIVDFANQLRDEGRSVVDAIVEAASVRLRPILMTSIATMAGAVPLVAAGGPGSASRSTIGVVVIFGVAFSTAAFALSSCRPSMRCSRHTRARPRRFRKRLETLERQTPELAGPA